MSNIKKPKIIVVLGPTSSGKSEVAIKLAQKFDGEIISADSRQIYRGLNIGSGKEPGHWDKKQKVYISSDVPHYAIDIVSPNTDYSAAKFKKYADRKIKTILKCGKLPIICGGTGFWIKSIVDNISYPEVKPNHLLRSKLRNKSTQELFKQLQKLDPVRAKTVDSKNPARLIRAIEICKELGKVPKLNCHLELTCHPELVSGSLSESHNIPKQVRNDNNHNFFQIGISIPKDKLQKNIAQRLKQRFKAGMIEEVEELHRKNRISWKRLESFGLGYRLIPQYLKSEIKNKEELFKLVYQAEKNYAKRQMTWFKKDKRIVWLKNYKDIEKEVKIFLK